MTRGPSLVETTLRGNSWRVALRYSCNNVSTETLLRPWFRHNIKVKTDVIPTNQEHTPKSQML